VAVLGRYFLLLQAAFRAHLEKSPKPEGSFGFRIIFIFNKILEICFILEIYFYFFSDISHE
jgi:hypothetical protein